MISTDKRKDSMKFAIILGTRPEIIKLSSIIRELAQKKEDFFIIHTNQHYSRHMDEIFFKELELPQSKYNLNIGSGSHAEQTGKMMVKIEKILEKEKPDVALVQGDTNTALAGSIAAAKLQISVGHVEAGLRSYDRTMPEELNRICADHVSDFLFAPTERQKKILVAEAIEKKKIFVCGNTIVDAVLENQKLAEKKSKILSKLKLRPKKYLLLTLHRPSNVDDKNTFENILAGLAKTTKELKMPIIFPIHPRTQNQLEKFNLKLPRQIKTIKPIGFLDFLKLEANAALCLTDSGGVQEESCILKTPCVTIRNNTERPETVEVGANILAGTDSEKIVYSTRKIINKKTIWKNPFGKGEAGKKMVKIIKNEKTPKVSVLGMGYMGLPTACLLAQSGFRVFGIDIDQKKISNLKRKKIKTSESGLKELFEKAIKSENLTFHTQIQPANIFIIAVPTPSINNQIELKFVKSATKMIAQVLAPNNLVILESTVAPNTSKKIIKPILDKNGSPYYLAHCPERAIPGNTLFELINNDRIIGGMGKVSALKTQKIYKKFVKGKIYLTDIATAETAKLLENSFRDINIAFANEIAKLSAKIGINPWKVIELANKHPRVNILKPGPGVGGHCIPLDPWFLVQDDPEAKFIRLARKINDSMPEYVVKIIAKNVTKKRPRIAVLGIAYKGDTDDSREAPATKIIEKMKKKNWLVKITDPVIKDYQYPLLPMEKVLQSVDGAVIVADHTFFKKFNFKKYPIPFIFDTRNILTKKQLHSETELLTFGSNKKRRE